MCEEHPARPGHSDSCRLCRSMEPFLCPHHLKCQRCLVKGLACGPYEHAEDTVDYLQSQAQRPVTSALFSQTFPGHDVNITQSPYLDGALQGDGVSAAFPGSQEPTQNAALGNDQVPTISSDMQEPSDNTALGSMDPLTEFIDDADLGTAHTEHFLSQVSRSEDHDPDVMIPFIDCDLLQIVQKYVAAAFDVLQHQGLDGDVYHDINEAKDAIERDMREVMKQMKELLEQAHQGGRIDQVRWMCPRLRTAINNTKVLKNVERTSLLLKINELYTMYKDISGADTTSQDLLLSDCMKASSEPKATALFVDSVQNSLARGSGNLKKLEDILPPFHRLAGLGNPKLFTLLEEEATSGRTPEKDFIGQTILHVAAAKGDDALIKHLLYLQDNYSGFHMDIEERDNAGRTAVYLAISHGQWSAYRLLRDQKASLKVRSRASLSPLAMAARGNHVAIMQDLIQAGCLVNEKVLPAMGGCPPLHIAAKEGHLDAVQILLRNGADSSFRTMGDGKTAAELARSNGHSNLADIIDKGG